MHWSKGFPDRNFMLLGVNVQNKPKTTAQNADFGVSTTILNTIDISGRWCMLNFGPL